VRVLLGICVVLAVGGCNAMFGVDGLTFDSGGTGATGGTSTGGGGTGGTGGTTSGSGGSGVGGGGGGTGATGPCGTFALLADDFGDDVVGPDWEILTSGSSVSEDGQLVVQVGTGAGAQFGAIRSEYAYDLRDSAVYVTADQTMDTGKTYLSVSVFNEGTLALQRSGDQIVVVRDYTVVAISTFDAGEHVMWRIREAEGTLYAETAGESMEFTEHYSMEVSSFVNEPGDLRFTRVTVGGSEPETSDTARFDDFNGGSASGTYCKTGSLVSTFDADLWPAWVQSTGEDECDVDVVSGELRLSFDEDPGPCNVKSTSRFDLAGSIFGAQVRRDNGGQPGLRILAGDGSHAEIQITSQDVVARVVEGMSIDLIATEPYDPMTHRWLRMREQGGTLWFETSPDGGSWSTLGSTELFFPPSPVQLQLFLSYGQFDEGYFDDVNVTADTP